MSSGKYPAEYYKDMVVNRYFGKVDRKDLGGVLRTFTPSAVFTIQSAFTTHEGRDTGIRKMFENLFENSRSSYTRISRTWWTSRTTPARHSSMSS